MRIQTLALFALVAAIGCGSNPSPPDVDFSPATPTSFASNSDGGTLRGTFRSSAGTLRASRAVYWQQSFAFFSYANIAF